MIIDAVLFHQEYEMLDFRLRLLYPNVDKFVIVEADRAFSGLHKPFNFEQHRQRFAWAEDKIKYFKLNCDISGLNFSSPPTDYQPNHDCWQIEYTQRRAMIAACNDFSDDDLLIMGDIDEIPAIEAIEWAKGNVRLLPVACQQHFFYYDLRYLRQEPWCGSIFSTLRTARSLGTQELRNRKNILTRIGNAGWHLSYFGDADKIREKLEAFSHQELNLPEFKNGEHINYCMSVGQDLFKRDVETTKISSDFFPQYFREIAPVHWWGGANLNKPEVFSTATVSLTMIVRNEEQNLPKCLESVKGMFDEIIVVDTGSIDRTKEIALQFGARIFDFAWVYDFAAARNVALTKATGDYVFWMDADDILDLQERAKLEGLLKTLNVEQKHAYVLRCASDSDKTTNSGQIIVDHIRLFPRLNNIRWTYKVHEQILPALSDAHIPIVWTDITVRHTGYIDSGAKINKRQRDWDILIKELVSNPEEPFVLYNLGMISFERQQWQTALGYFKHSFSNIKKLAAFESIRRKLYGMMAWTYQILEQYDESLCICEEGLVSDREDAELWFRKAVSYRYQLKTVEAEACWRHILRLKRPQKFCSIDQGIYGHLTRRNLAILAKERGDYVEAQEQWKAILAECPEDADAMRSFANVI